MVKPEVQPVAGNALPAKQWRQFPLLFPGGFVRLVRLEQDAGIVLRREAEIEVRIFWFFEQALNPQAPLPVLLRFCVVYMCVML